MCKQWVTWNMSTGYLAVEATLEAAEIFEFTAGAVRSIGHAVEVLGDAGYIVVTTWLASAMSDVHMVCMVERVNEHV